MNTVQIAALYTHYPELAHLLSAAPADAHRDLWSILLLAREDSARQAYHEIRIRQFAPEGISLDQRCAPRVFAWACAQLPAADQRWAEGEVWSVRTADYTSEQVAFTARHHAGSAFATLLRGMQHYQRKLNRRTRKLLAQLRAYHAQQQAAEALRATMQAASAEVLLPTYGISSAEYWRRTDTAEDMAEHKQQNGGRLDGAYGCDILWHPDFPVGCVRSISVMALHEIEAFLSGDLSQTLNVSRPLDRADYLYLADCLREGLVDNPTPLAALRLARALAWVEQAAEALLPTAQPRLTASLSEAVPALAA